MNLPKEIADFLACFYTHGYQAYVVGGCVRDMLLGRTPPDWDICTSAHPEEVSALFSHRTVIPTGLRHGTVTVLLDHYAVEVTTFRTEGPYHDSRHPSAVFYTPHLEEDLKRRDFTINAMAYSPETGLIDPFGGQKHLAERLLCCVGEPRQRLREDALRILRALRFAATYQLTVDPATAEALHREKSGLGQIAAERILAELTKILTAPYLSVAVLPYPDLLAEILPAMGNTFSAALPSWESFLKNLCALPPIFPLRLFGLLSLSALITDDAPAALQEGWQKCLQQLKTDRETTRTVLDLGDCFFAPAPQTLADTRRWVNRFGFAIIDAMMDYRTTFPDSAFSVSAVRHHLNEIREKSLCCNLSDLDIGGRDLIAHGITDGKEIGRLLSRALEAVMAENLPNEKSFLLKYLFS